MAIEDTLLSIDTSLKIIVQILQSAGAITAVNTEVGTTDTAAPAATTAKGKGKKDNSTNADPAKAMGLVAGDPEGTRYWVAESLMTVYAQKPGDADPEDQAFKIETAAHYTAKKAEFAKKSSQATGAQSTGAAANPAKSTPDASSASSAPDWKSVVLPKLKELNGNKDKPGQGPDGVRAVLKQFGLEGKTVPALEALGKNAEVLKFVEELMAPKAADDSGDEFGL